MRGLALLLIAVLVLTMLPVSSIEASPAETIIPLSWHAEYFDNQYLIGPPVVVREEDSLNHNWGTNRPFDGIPQDYFTVRWATRTTLEAGTYRFSVTADDSVKVTVDYTEVVLNTINNPKPGDALAATFNLGAGSHYFQVDYRENVGNASITATLEILDGEQGIPPLPATPAAYVTAFSLRVRSGPGLNYMVLGQEQENTIVHLTGRNSDATWVRVTVPDGTTGWMSAAWLDPNVDLTTLPNVTSDVTDGNTPDVPIVGRQVGLVTAISLTVRSAPDTSGEVLGYVARFTPLNLVGRNAAGTWLLIMLENGMVGWVSESFVLSASNIFSLPVMSI